MPPPKTEAEVNERLLDWIERDLTLEYGLVLGLGLFLVGLTIDSVILARWLASDLGQLEQRLVELLLALSAALLSLGALVPLHAAANTASPGSTLQQTAESNRQFIADAFTQWQQGGKTFFQDVLSPDVVWTIKGTSPVAGTYRGRQDFLDRAVKPFADRLSAPIRPVVKDIWANGNDVVVHWDGATTAADGVPYSNSYVWIFRMKDRRASEVIAFLDLAPYDDVLRRVPAPK